MEFLSPERLSELFKVTEPDSSGVGKGGWHVSFPSQTFLLLGAEDASFWQPMPFLSPRIMVDSDFQTPFPPFGEPSGRAPPYTRSQGQLARQSRESHFIFSSFS